MCFCGPRRRAQLLRLYARLITVLHKADYRLFGAMQAGRSHGLKHLNGSCLEGGGRFHELAVLF